MAIIGGQVTRGSMPDATEGGRKMKGMKGMKGSTGNFGKPMMPMPAPTAPPKGKRKKGGKKRPPVPSGPAQMNGY